MCYYGNMEDKVINIYKKTGETPLDCINNIKKEHPDWGILPMTYAGRLDPLAEGVLLVLIGDECNKKDQYLNLPKEYEVDVLFGFATDTYDVMGKINKKKELFNFLQFGSSSPLVRGIKKLNNPEISNSYIVSEIKKTLQKFIGKIKQSYPPYSSRPVKGIPLFKWARDGKLDEIEIPTHDVFVEGIEIINQRYIKGNELLEEIKDKIYKVKGDFRQKEILSLWNSELKNKSELIYPIFRLKISCGSGVYMRSIANDMGEILGVGALALKIVRIRVGEYILKQ